MALVLDYLRFTFSIGIRVNANLKRLRVLELKTILVREIASFNKCWVHSKTFSALMDTHTTFWGEEQNLTWLFIKINREQTRKPIYLFKWKASQERFCFFPKVSSVPSVMSSGARCGRAGCPSHFGLEGFLTMPAVGAEAFACAPVRDGVGLKPCYGQEDQLRRWITSPEQMPLEIKQKGNIETLKLPLDGANSYYSRWRHVNQRFSLTVLSDGCLFGIQAWWSQPKSPLSFPA